MTISSAQSASILLGNGVTSEWTLDFVPDASEYIYVTYTNASGTETVLTSSQYTITINPVASGQIWASGFTLTYPTSGAPIPNGTSLTVQRILPLQQLTSLQNQGNFYPQAVEAGLDTLEMQIQQVSARGGSYRGVWATDVIYNFGDIVQDGINGAYTNNIYVCAIANTSGTWATDLAAGDWALVLNIQTINAAGTYLPLSGGTISGNLGVTGTTTLAGLSASGTVSGTGFSTYLASPPAIGGTAPAAGSFTALSGTTSIKLNGSPVFDKINVQRFTSSGTYTPTSGMVYAILECWGAGGGGGGTGSNSTGTAGGGGGGAGGYSKKTVTASTLGSSQTITIGAGGNGATAGTGNAGGTTSVGTLCVANGGSGGPAGTSAGTLGGAGGAAGTGDITGTGCPGGNGCGSVIDRLAAWAGAGGSTLVGGGGVPVTLGFAGTINGNNGTGNGSGGSGSVCYDNTSNATGGNGASGLVIITEFLSA